MFKKLLLSTALLLFSSIGLYAQFGSISGTVTDNNGEPLPGANVFIEELKRGASTDTNGEYEISNIPTGEYTIRASFIGYQDFVDQVQIGADPVTLNIELQPGSNALSEVVVVGYGSTTQRNLTGSVGKVSSKSIESIHLTTFEQSLQGKVSGVQITSTSGVLGAPVAVRVRGTTSLNASSQPLYVVDGIPLTRAGGEIGAGFGGQGINPFINLNPNNIASIQVLKSATAAAIYGARGSNGVVLIETKDGIAGKTQIDINTSIGFTEPTEEYELLNGTQFQEMAAVALENTFGSDLGLRDAEIANTDWTDLVTRSGTIQNYDASISGGNNSTTFLLSGAYSKEEGYARPNQLEKFDLFGKINHQASDRLSVGISLNPSRSENARVATSNAVAAPYTFAALEAPIIPDRGPNGELNDGVEFPGPVGGLYSAFPGTPLSNAIGDEFLSTVTQVNATSFADYAFTENLSFRTDLSVQYLQVFEEEKVADFATDGFPTGSAFASNNQFLNYATNNILTYSNTFGDHNITAVAGVTWQHEESDFFSVSGTDFVNNDLKKLDSAAEITAGGGFGTSYAFQNNLARIEYGFKDKYLLTLTASFNGSSRFPEDNRYGFFPAASAAWIASDEAFLQDVSWLSFLKLKAGAGVSGNSEIGNFNSQALLDPGASYNDTPGLVLAQLAKPELGWEETFQIDGGIEYGIFNNRITGEIGYFNKLTSELLLDNPISATNGFTGFLENNGEIRNKGFEFEISADVIVNPDMVWTIFANVSTIDNEVEELPGGERIFGENLVREGEPLGAFFVVPFAGVDDANGDALFLDLDGNETNVFSLENRRVMGDPFPDHFGGFGTSFSYKGLDAQVNFQYSQGNEIYWSDGEFLRTNLASVFNQDESQFDFWTPENPDATVPEPRAFTNNGNQGTNSRYLVDGSYLRLKNAVIGYTIPGRFVNNNRVRVYVRGTNLLTFTEFPGLDPEQTGNSDANATAGNVFFQPPQQRTIQFGIELGF